MDNQNRSSFSGKLGFVLAAAGSAVGLGNIWRFPYLAAKHGGGIFLLVYIALVVTFGFTLMAAEIALGRKTGQSVIGAYKTLDKRFSFLGYLAAIVPAIILPYYCVIGGWVTKYLVMFVSGKGVETVATTSEGSGFFDSFIAGNETLIWFFIYLAATAVIVLMGVDKGIERMSKIMMPILIVLSIGIAVYSIFLPGALDGLVYYLMPDFSHFSFTTVLAAMGQMFYSMSLAMGIMVTYGSYMKKEVNIESSTRNIEIFDTGIAILAGLMIVPAVYAFSGGDTSALGKGPGLMFVTLPKVFESFPGGQLVGAVFFVLVFFAALTSSISLMETIVSIISDKFKVGRKTSSFIVIAISLVLGTLSALGYGTLGNVKIGGMAFLDFFDFISNSVIMPIVALITCIFVGYVIKPQAIIGEIELNGKFKSKTLFTIVIKYVAPVFIVGILIFSILEGMGIIKV